MASLPVTPVPAVAGPFTGGQYVAHEPLQFDFVEVSGTNQYSVKPLALVRTVTPPILVVFSAPLLAAALEAGAAALEVVLPEPVEWWSCRRQRSGAWRPARPALAMSCSLHVPVQVRGRFLTLINVTAGTFVHTSDQGL